MKPEKIIVCLAALLAMSLTRCGGAPPPPDQVLVNCAPCCSEKAGECEILPACVGLCFCDRDAGADQGASEWGWITPDCVKDGGQ